MNIRMPEEMVRPVHALADALSVRNLARMRSAAGRRMPPDELARIEAEVAARVADVEAARVAPRA